jgi:alpha-tubulin suppressor-like RCC1 family protein
VPRIQDGAILVTLLVVAGCGDNLTPPPATAFMSGNEEATCVIDAAGALFCWGRLNGSDPSVGEQGDKVTGLPVQFGTDLWRTIGVGPWHACGVRDDGTLWCWGRNCGGQLGDGTRDAHVQPIQIGTESRWQSVAVGGGHSCAIDDAGALACWGGLDYGQSDCQGVPTQTPTAIDGVWQQVSSGWYASHGLAADGTLWRWHDYRLEDDPSQPFEAPVPLGAAKWRTIATGLDGVFGVREDGALAYVQFDASEETQIGSDTDWASVAARDHTCALKRDGTLWCWGRNDMGQLGIGTSSDDVPDPMQISRIGNWTAVTAGYSYSCGVYDRQVYCWGANTVGEIGIGMPYDHEIHTPEQIGVQLIVD